MYRISILTLFPDVIRVFASLSILKRAITKGLVNLEAINIRDFATDRYKSVDDHPYGGGQGMIMRVDVIDHALTSVKSRLAPTTRVKTVLLSPQGERYSQKVAKSFTENDHLILICGHYEGIDERVRFLVDQEISIGDYILTGGELPALVIADSVIRLIPGVLANTKATQDESFSGNPPILEYPQYTRPEIYRNKKVPAILLSGDHKKIKEWREKEAFKKTRKRRPDLLKRDA